MAHYLQQLLGMVSGGSREGHRACQGEQVCHGQARPDDAVLDRLDEVFTADVTYDMTDFAHVDLWPAGPMRTSSCTATRDGGSASAKILARRTPLGGKLNS